MRTQAKQSSWFFRVGIAVSAAILLAACDSSKLQSGIEGTGITDKVAAAVSRGPIASTDGLDVNVNGVSWSAAGAKTVIDGAPAGALDLKRGMVATVQGQYTAASRGTATVIETQIVVRGPILETRDEGYRLNVLGQTILIDRGTERDLPGSSLSGLSVGQIVAVSGFIDGFGNVRATLIAASAGTDTRDWVVNGVVTAVGPGAQRFSINGLEVSYTPALLAAMSSGAIEKGQPLAVSGRSFTDDGALIATSIAAYDTSLPATEGDTVLTGVLGQYEGDSLTVGEQRIVLVPGASITGSLTAGVFVRVTGRMSAGILYASDVLVLGIGAVYDLVGRIDSVDVAARRLTMFSMEFAVAEDLLPGFSMRLDDVAVGDRVQVLSYENRFVYGITRNYGQPTDVVGPDWISGEYLRDLSPPVQFTLYGVADWIVQVESTDFFGYNWGVDPFGSELSCGVSLVSAERFWQLAAQPKPGHTYVGAWGRFEGNVFVAESVYLCVPGGLAP